AEEYRPRLLGVDLHGVRIDDLHPVDRRERCRAPQLVGGISETLEAELHRIGVEVLAVVELDTTPQLHLPRGRRGQLGHLGGERGYELEALIALEQRLG